MRRRSPLQRIALASDGAFDAGVPRGGTLGWAAAGGAVAILGGAAAAVQPQAAVILVALLLLGLAVAWRPEATLVVLIASLFVQVVNVGGVTVSRLAAPAAVLVVAVSLLRGSAVIRGGAPLAWAGAYGAWAFASGIWTIDFDATLTSLGSLGIALAYGLAFAALLRSTTQLKTVLYALSIVALGVGVYAIATSQGRAGISTGDANYFAAVEVIALPLVLALVSETSTRWLRWALYFSAVVIVAAIFSSLSRGGLVALMVVVAFILLVPARMFFRSVAHKAVVIAFLAVGIGLAFTVTSAALTPRIEAIFTPEGRTGSGRLNAWRGAWTSIQERPLLGLGYGAFAPSANELMLRTPGVDLSNYVLRERGLEAHSAYIGTTADIGIPGLALFLGLLASTARSLRRAAQQARRLGAPFAMRTANALFISLVAWSVASLFLSSETARPLWIMVGMALALPTVIYAEVAQQAPGDAGEDSASTL